MTTARTRRPTKNVMRPSLGSAFRVIVYAVPICASGSPRFFFGFSLARGAGYGAGRAPGESWAAPRLGRLLRPADRLPVLGEERLPLLVRRHHGKPRVG